MTYQNRLIAHVLLTSPRGVLVLKRSMLNKGFGGYWDLPGGKVNCGELPQAAVIRECREELAITVSLSGVVFEQSECDERKHVVTTRLFYHGTLAAPCALSSLNARLNQEEHTKVAYFDSFADWDATEKFVPVLQNFLTSTSGKQLLKQCA